MEKFTKIKKEVQKNTDEVDNKLQIAILPYFKDDGYIFLKYEKFPNLDGKDETYQLTCIRGNYDEKETESQNLRRVLYAKTGIVLNNMFSIDVDESFFKDFDNYNKYYVCLLELSYNDYKQSSVKLTEENKVVKISLGDIDNIKYYDLITNYMILKLKYENNIR